MKVSVLVLFMATVCATTSLAKEVKALGQVPDPDALAKVETYCIDPMKGSQADAAEVRKFAADESGPKKILGKLRWTLTGDCSRADAVMSFNFQLTQKVAYGASSTDVSTAGNVPVDAYEAAMTVSDRASGKLLYKVNGEATENSGYRSMVNAVQKLSKDLKKL